MNRNSNIKQIFNNLFIIHLFLNITHCLCQIASGYIAGNFLDSIAVSCNSLINPINTLIVSIAAIYSSAGEILCGKYMGIGDKKSINKTFTNSIMLSIITGLLLTILCIIFSKDIIIFLKASSEMIDAASIYFNGFSIGIIAYIMMPVLVNFLHMENEGKYITASVILLTVFYCLFGYLFIKVLNLSYFGFGLTNSLSNICTVLFLLIKIIKNRNQISFDIKCFNLSLSKQIFILGFSSGTAGAMIGFRNILLNTVLFDTGGSIAVAARSIFVNSSTLNDAIVTSILQSTTMIASVCIGEKNRDDLNSIIKYLIDTILPIYSLFVIFQIGISKYICPFFSNDPKCIELAINATMLYLPSTIIEMFSDVIISLYLILGYKKFVNGFNISHCILIHIFYTLITKSLLGVYSVFTGYLFTEILSIAIIFIFIIIINKRLPKRISDIIPIKDSSIKVIKFNKTFSNFKNITNISKNVSEFLSMHNIDHRRSYFSGLFIEEMCANIFERGFNKKNNDNKRIDLFVSVDNDEINIRIRDNSIAFDPTSSSIIFNPDDPCKNIGLRIVSKLSKEMSYQNVFGFNNMIIKI